MNKKNKKEKAMRAENSVTIRAFLSIVIAIFATMILGYIGLPALTIHSTGIIWLLVIGSVICIVLSFASAFSVIRDSDKAHIKLLSKTSLIAFVIAVALMLFMAIGEIISSPIFNATRYQKLTDITESEFTDDFAEINSVTELENANVPYIDCKTAQKVGNRQLGNLKNSSWYEINNEYNLIEYQGKYYRISPLEYGGYFKYQKAQIIPGYILVDAQTAEAKYVTVDGGFKYSPSAYFGNNLRRHLRTQYPSAIFGKSFFEIDEEGNPYWITPVNTTNVALYGGLVEHKAIVTNAVTGISNIYNVGESSTSTDSDDTLPSWVDHAVDLDNLMYKTECYYLYCHGYWNSVISQTDVYNLSYEFESDDLDDDNFDGYNSIVDLNGDVCFITGITPANSAESNVGFVVANCRTGQITSYEAPGAEESSVQSVAEGLVQNLGYKATFPVVINVAGEPSYFILLKDKSDLVQKFAIVNIKNYAIAVYGDSLDSVITEYKSKLNSTTESSASNGVLSNTSDTSSNDELLNSNLNKDSSNIEDTTSETSRISTTEEEKFINAEIDTQIVIIEEIYEAEIDGTTYYYYKFIGDDKLYRASIKISESQVTFKEKMKLKISYYESDINEIVEIAEK